MARSVPAIESLITEIERFINKDLLLGELVDQSIEEDVCFSCELWNYGYCCECGSTEEVIITPIRVSINIIFLNIIDNLKALLNDKNNNNYAFKSQIERMLTIALDLQNKINSIQCITTCGDSTLISQLLAIILITMCQLITVLENLNGLLAYQDICGCLGENFFDIIMGKFINSITELQAIAQDWNNIVMSFFYYSSISTKSYVASYVPNQPIIIQQPNQNPRQHACVPCPPVPPAVHQKTNSCTGFPCY